MKHSRYLALTAVLAVAAVLPSCVTTTTGGFVVETSDEQALEDYIQLALGYYDANDMAGARRHINNALEIDDRHSEIYNVLAVVLQREGDLDLAEDNFRRAISLNSGNSRARNNYGAFLFGQQRYAEAYNQLKIVSEDVNYQGRAIAFENLGRAALRAGEQEDAEAAFRRALTLNANLYVSALEMAQISIRKENWVYARRYFQQYVTLAEFYSIPHTPRALLTGIEVETQFQNDELVENYALILTTLYQDSPEYQLYQSLTNAN